MWPLDRRAGEVLTLPGETVTPWAVFEWRWYLQTYPQVASLTGDDDPPAVLEYYLNRGQQQGHSPNLLFDEQWHRLAHPQIDELVAEGHYTSAFDAYCRRGSLDRSAHWLFDELAYRERCSDLTNQVLAEQGLANGYDHYLRHGAAEGRIGHLLFDPGVYLSQFDPAGRAAICRNGVFQHYLNRIETAEPELATSVHFDPMWYVRRYPEVAKDIEARRWKCALHHYLCNDTPTAFDPLEGFSESWYLDSDPGLRAVIASRLFRNGYAHFLRFGAKELRSPASTIDLAWYAVQPAVRADLDQRRAPDAYAHWLTFGASAGLPATNPRTEKLSRSQARQMHQQHAVALLPIAGRFGYRFECLDKPALSVVMMVRDGFATTMSTIASLHTGTASDTELIIIDRGSGDETCSIGQYVPAAKVFRFESDAGWWPAAEAGRHLVGAPLMLFLSSEAQIAPGSVARARARLSADASVGAVGGMILQPHGAIAQAGGMVWNDGSTRDYMRDASPLQPEANFVRDVDFCAPDFLMIRSELLCNLDGFDRACAPGYEVVDLCLRIAQAGFRVVYDPSVMITAGDVVQPGSGPCEHFRRKHAAALSKRLAPGDAAEVFARHTAAGRHRVLFIEDTVPLRQIGSGFVRANDLVRVMASLGCAVTVFPVNGCDHGPVRVFSDMPEQVEVMHSFSLDRLAAFLEARPDYYDTVWVARMHNLTLVRPMLMQAAAEGALKARIVLDTEAVTPYREAMKAALVGEAYDLEAAMNAILADAAICRLTVAVTPGEAETLRRHGFSPVLAIGHMIEPRPTAAAFAKRSGMLFVGAIHNNDSPNLDGLIWFVDAVLPLIEAELRWETRLTIAGYIGPGVDLDRFRHHPRITLLGPVANLDPLYNAHRIFVAPTRYAAGAPYKVLEAASRGLPVVATEVLRGELDWVPDQEILATLADPAAFAANVVALHRDEALWRTVREGALAKLRQENSPGGFVAAAASAFALSPTEPPST